MLAKSAAVTAGDHARPASQPVKQVSRIIKDQRPVSPSSGSSRGKVSTPSRRSSGSGAMR